MTVPTVAWQGEVPGALELIDQRALPSERTLLRLEDVDAVREAIRTLAVRGAPAIGIAAAYGVVVGAQAARDEDAGGVARAARDAADRLATARPTAVNLFWALERMKGVLERSRGAGDALVRELLAEARAIHAEDRASCRAMGRHGAALLPDPVRVLTHCNAGGLATGGYGTAVGCVYAAAEAGKRVSVVACETRPLLQGARLTTFELQESGVPVTLIGDGMTGLAMRQGRVDAVIVGADRIAANGDVANKIGTYTHAVLARRHGIPFYVAAPASTFDLSLPSGEEIPIEERDPEELRSVQGRPIAPPDVPVWNPAFDVTPAELVTAIVTERGVIRPVDGESVRALLGERTAA